MASILDIYTKTPPTNGKIDTKVKEKTPIEPDGGLNLSKDDVKLERARGGKLNIKRYSDSIQK
jgi:hypothetical protein